MNPHDSTLAVQDAGKSSRRISTIAGYFIASAGLVFAASYRFILLPLYIKPLPNGGYGEAYGPVTGMASLIYFICALLAIFGIALVFSATRRRKL
jgi:hypothetical protein